MAAIDHHSNKGFTLLEVMVAVSIISIVLISLFKMQYESIELATTTNFEFNAIILSKQLLADIEQDLINMSEMNGNFGPDYPGIEWSYKISKESTEEFNFDENNNQHNLTRIEIELQDQSGQKSYKTTTWRFAFE